jgi:pimeloyl-ACP methyl ester carboxylesterase
MQYAKIKILSILVLTGFFIFTFPSLALACTYQATITGNHLDFTITSDLDKLAVIQYIKLSGSAFVTKMYGPDVGTPWTYFDDPNCNVEVNYPIGCRQIRSGGLGGGAFWQWTADGFTGYHILPGGIWGLDFDSPPTYDSLQIGYGTSRPNQVWVFCSRTGNISTPTPIPTETPSPTPTTTPSPTPTPTPTPSPTATPTPSPTPPPTPTPIPVTKVFFVPGIGASWNADALLNCKPDNYFGGWILAPFAEEIYKPILEALSSSGWDTKPFYYDWRKDVRDSANILSGYIGANSNPDEKVDLVGHSMGGLVGRAYVQLYQGGQLAKLLMVGSPHQGSSLAYPLWSGGEIWTDNLLEKIAVTLYLNHCGGLFSNNRQIIQDQSPSIQNLLPTNDYLFDMQTQKLKPVSTMSAKNNWLPADFIAPFWSVKVGTLSGTGFPTLNIINVISPSKNDLRQGNWTDGKPIGKQYTNQGDGTVLASSSQLEGAINTTINQTHSGLVASTEGMTEILRFLGSPNSLEDPVYIEPSSALLIIGYPGNFWVTDPNGNVTQDQAGVVSFINPVSGNYDLRVVPTSTDTLFIIAQFLPNGQTFYKEYHIKGIQPVSKIVTFDTKHPSGDILKDKVTPKPPSFPKIPKFPKFWDWFWGWWRKR